MIGRRLAAGDFAGIEGARGPIVRAVQDVETANVGITLVRRIAQRTEALLRRRGNYLERVCVRKDPSGVSVLSRIEIRDP
ncbi:MAG: hypothetical protein ACI9WU_000866 [Myxococcota bacterium]